MWFGPIMKKDEKPSKFKLHIFIFVKNLGVNITIP